MSTTSALFKTTIIVWSPTDPTGVIETSDLIRRAETGDSIISAQTTVPVGTDTVGADSDATEAVFGFFDIGDEGTLDDDEDCGDACAAHQPDCDGYCNHLAGHRNACWVTPGQPEATTAVAVDAVQAILVRLDSLPDGETGDDLELDLLRDLRDAVAANTVPADETRCLHCGTSVSADAQGSWVDGTDGDGCDNPTGVHQHLPAGRVDATIVSDDRVRSASFDARAYLDAASDDDVLALLGGEFGPGEATDAVAWSVERQEPGVESVMAYCTEQTTAGDECGFSVSLDVTQARAFVAARRPTLARYLPFS